MKDFEVIAKTMFKLGILLLLLVLLGSQAIYYSGYYAGKKRLKEREVRYEQHHQYVLHNLE